MPISSAVVLLLALAAEGDRAPHTLARLVLPGSGVSLTAPFLALLLLLFVRFVPVVSMFETRHEEAESKAA